MVDAPKGAEGLEAACHEVARSVLWSRTPRDVDEISVLAQEFLTIAQGVEVLPEDGDLVGRAVRYIAQVHADPSLGRDTRWFRERLDALIELARPTCVLTPEAADFLNDVEAGIKEVRSYPPA